LGERGRPLRDGMKQEQTTWPDRMSMIMLIICLETKNFWKVHYSSPPYRNVNKDFVRPPPPHVFSYVQQKPPQRKLHTFRISITTQHFQVISVSHSSKVEWPLMAWCSHQFSWRSVNWFKSY
jgi:hypothetical protein